MSMRLLPAVILLVLAVITRGTGGDESVTDDNDTCSDVAPAVVVDDNNNVMVHCTTTAGPITIRLQREWSPHGYDRAKLLFERGYYDASHFFRVIPNFLVQFGLSYTTKANLKHLAETTIPDDPNRSDLLPFREGMVSFAGSGPNSRTSQLFIAYDSAGHLGKSPWETPIGEVVEGMENVRKLYSKYGEGPQQNDIRGRGSSYIEKNYPLLDKFETCTVRRVYSLSQEFDKTKPARIRKDKSKYQSGSTNSEISDPIKTVAKYGEAQRVEGQEIDKIMDVIVRTIHYMENDIHGPNATHNLSTNLLAECRNKHQDCAFWAAIGECEKNPSYMKINCSPSCQTCVLLDIANRCPPLGDDVRPGLLPGEMNGMFERIVTTAPGNQSNTDFVIDEGMTNYTVIVHSRPTPLDDGVEPIISEKRDLHEPPWVITFEDFITVDECRHLIDLGYKSNYKRSEDVGHALPDGTFTAKKSETRTSENAWCSSSNGCRNDTVVSRIHDRIAKVTGIAPENSEDFQVLKYEPGQFYRAHHDYIPHHRDRRCGPRILTFFLYLSDVEEGGATNFPQLEIAVKPKAGRALLWPSVLDSNPKEKEPRTDHEAQNVIKGIKFGANAWLHLYNYVDAKEMGCT